MSVERSTGLRDDPTFWPTSVGSSLHVDGAIERSLMKKAVHGDDWRASLAVLKIRRPEDWNPDPDAALVQRLIGDLYDLLHAADAELAQWAFQVVVPQNVVHR